jgi:ATP-dependent helicase HepA
LLFAQEALDPRATLRPGALVRSSTNRLGTGKIVRIEGDSAVVEYFHSTAKTVLQEVPLKLLKRVSLPPQTRCYFQRNSQWIAGRVGQLDGDQYEIDLPNGRAEYLPEALLHVRTNLPIADPTSILGIKAHETAAYFQPRFEYLRNVYEQRATSRGLTGVLSARIQLLPHQLRVVRRVVEDPVQRYLLADEVGLGKTIEAGCILRQFLIDNPAERVIVIVPQLLRDQWEQELDEKFDSNGLDGEVVLTTHEDFTTVSNGSPFGLIIVDEAQHPAGWAFADHPDKRKKFATLQKLALHTQRLLLLSATPILHNEREFLAMLHLLSPDVYSLDDLQNFRLRVETRQELGRVLVGLQPDRPAFLIRGQIQKLRQMLSGDKILESRLDYLEALLKSEEDSHPRAAAIREVRAHISEAYRLHHRMLRNRRSKIQAGILIPRGSSAPGKQVRVEEWDSDERFGVGFRCGRARSDIVLVDTQTESARHPLLNKSEILVGA